jgi:hypothetical protein
MTVKKSTIYGKEYYEFTSAQQKELDTLKEYLSKLYELRDTTNAEFPEKNLGDGLVRAELQDTIKNIGDLELLKLKAEVGLMYDTKK